MGFIDFLGFFLAVLVGFTMGLFGGGGSILTVPILVYLFKITPSLATAYSLFVVGIAALNGVISYARQKLVSIKAAVAFGVPSLFTVFLARGFILPALPQILLHTSYFTLTKEMGLMMFFSIVMLLASVSMIKGRKAPATADTEKPWNYPRIILQSSFVGLIIGIVGAGGGFLFVPALMFFTGLNVKEAIGTSLFIITFNSLIGFTGDLMEQSIEWGFLSLFSGLAIGGIYLGIYISQFVSPAKLKVSFGWFVLLMGMFILLKESFF
ncbi:sulfite exporter TauE/SafE family protein [uncultured Microscilla sp.]|uniref:sulfite exporter TauE/SafE family protein n=1 Tax=uncultured Microscilla sp. TaxID=432653 RepID=UPI00262544E0|nr:sulfite exporter TauE/SafE family protein [uncultured Microscilla sp.]